MEEFFLRKESQVYCDEGGGNFDVINYVVVVEGNEGCHRYMWWWLYFWWWRKTRMMAIIDF
jgi:hypothetical protein